jgi:hypothetical protein
MNDPGQHGISVRGVWNTHSADKMMLEIFVQGRFDFFDLPDPAFDIHAQLACGLQYRRADGEAPTFP